MRERSKGLRAAFEVEAATGLMWVDLISDTVCEEVQATDTYDVRHTEREYDPGPTWKGYMGLAMLIGAVVAVAGVVRVVNPKQAGDREGGMGMIAGGGGALAFPLVPYVLSLPFTIDTDDDGEPRRGSRVIASKNCPRPRSGTVVTLTATIEPPGQNSNLFTEKIVATTDKNGRAEFALSNFSKAGLHLGQFVSMTLTAGEHTEVLAFENEAVRDSIAKWMAAPRIASGKPALRVETGFLAPSSGNTALDAGESATLNVAVVNEGTAPAHQVFVEVEEAAGLSAIDIGAPAVIKALKPGEKKLLEFGVHAGGDLKTGQTEFVVQVSEFHASPEPVILSVRTRALPPTVDFGNWRTLLALDPGKVWVSTQRCGRYDRSPFMLIRAHDGTVQTAEQSTTPDWFVVASSKAPVEAPLVYQGTYRTYRGAELRSLKIEREGNGFSGTYLDGDGRETCKLRFETEPSTLPPYLTLTASLDDERTGGNGRLDSGEVAYLEVKLNNAGPGSAGAIEFGIGADRPGAFENRFPHYVLQRMGPGTTAVTRVPLVMPDTLGDGRVSFTLTASESGGNDAQTQKINLQTGRQAPAKLVLDKTPIFNDSKSTPPLVNLNTGARWTSRGFASLPAYHPQYGDFAYTGLARCDDSLFTFQRRITPGRESEFALMRYHDATRRLLETGYSLAETPGGLTCVEHVLYFSDGRRLLAVSPDNPGAPKTVMRGFGGSLFAFVDSGKLLVLSPKQKRFDLESFNLQTRKRTTLAKNLSLPSKVNALAVSSDEREIYLSVPDAGIAVLEKPFTGKLRWLGHSGSGAIGFVAPGYLLAAGGDRCDSESPALTLWYQDAAGTLLPKRIAAGFASDLAGSSVREVYGLVEKCRGGFSVVRASLEGAAAPNEGVERFVYADGNANGIIENGETVEIVATVRNLGAGPAYDVSATARLPEGVPVALYPNGGMRRRVVFRGNDPDEPGTVHPGGTGTATFRIRVPFDARLTGLPVRYEIADFRSRPLFLSAFSAMVTYPAAQQKPKLIYDYVIHDGGTAASRGNRNGVIDQGEIIDLEMAVQNRGEVGSPRGRLKLTAQMEGVAFSQDTVELLDLSAGSASQKARFVFAAKRTARVGNLPIKITLSPEGFDDVEDVINLEIVPEGVSERTFAGAAKAGTSLFVPVALKAPGQLWSVDMFSGKYDRLVRSEIDGDFLLSRDRGKSFMRFGSPASGVTFTAAAFDADEDTNLVAAGSDGKLYFAAATNAANPELAWVPADGFGGAGTSPVVVTLANLPAVSKEGAYLASTADGTWRSVDGGKTWSPVTVPSPMGAGRVAGAPAFEDFIAYYSRSGEVFVSADRGATFSVLRAAGIEGEIVSATARRSGKSSVLYAGTSMGDVYASSNGGTDWRLLTSEKPYQCAPGCKVGAVLADQAGRVVYAAVAGKGIVRVTLPRGGRTASRIEMLDAGLRHTEGLDEAQLAFNQNGDLIVKTPDELYELGVVSQTELLSALGFRLGSVALSNDIQQSLDGFVALAKKEPGKIVVSGHTDNVGPVDVNLALSKDRAERVKAYLVANGIPAERVMAEGYGMSRPIASNATEAGRSQNRRVELSILK